MKYSNINEIINNIPSYLKIDYDYLAISVAYEIADKFYKPIEDYSKYNIDKTEPSVTEMYNAVNFVLSPFKQHIDEKLYAMYWYIYNLFLYRLVYLVNEEVGYKYVQLLDKIKSEFDGLYTFTGIDINHEDIISF